MTHARDCLIIAAVLLFLGDVFAQVNDSSRTKYSATDSAAIAELTTEQLQTYQSNFFPLSLAEQGRQSLSAWRGMPPGYLDYAFQNIRLINPLWGEWDNQLVPFEIIRRYDLDESNLQYRLIPMPVTNVGKPVSRIAYSQDYQFGLSYLDVNLYEFYRENSYFQLGGNNFLRTGSFGEATKTQVNTYRAQLHHTFSPKFSIDAWYWQLRHRFRLSSYPEISIIRKYHRVGQILFTNLNFTPDSTQKLIVTPYGYKWGESYKTPGYTEYRRSETYSLGLKLDYQKAIENNIFRVSSDIVRHRITQALHFEKQGQTDIEIKGNARRKFGAFWLQAGGGYRYLQKVGQSFLAEAEAGAKSAAGWEVKIAAARQPQNVPLAPLFWKGDSIRNLDNPQLPLREGVDASLGVPLTRWFHITLQPFYQRFKHAWGYSPVRSEFIQRNFENSGLSVKTQLRIWRFSFKDEFTYSSNYQESFTPQANNVLIGRMPLDLFKGALKLDGYAIYHFIGKFRKVDFYPLVNQYGISSAEDGYFHILDFKVLAHIRTATLFFVWENNLSQDYAIVDNYTEVYRQFRFGIYWTLFD